jgi:hypothetical protein
MAKPNVPVYQEDEEYAQVRRDLIRVVIMNTIFFGALFVLYFWNRSTNGVTEFFDKFIKF